MSNTLLWQRLEHRLTRAVEEFPGVAGICVKDLTLGEGLSIHGDEEFPTASTIKIHVLTRLLVRVEQGELDLDSKVTITPQMQVPGSGVVNQLQGDVDLNISNLATLMIIVSDNTATNLCIDMAGIDETNAMLRDMGLTKTTLRRKMMDSEAIARGDENVATPNECVSMLEMLNSGRPTEWVAKQCLEFLKKPKSGPLNRALGSGVPLANKPGGMDRVRCDAGIVFLRRRPYAIAVMTKFGIGDLLEQERFIIDAARDVHETMLALDGTNEHGLGLPG